jgi:GTP pyrophosphokinase
LVLRLNDIVDRVRSVRPEANVELIQKAYVFTAKVHRGQLRKSGEPYLIHPINVAWLLADWNLDEETVATGLLHDTVEDTVATVEEIAEVFGENVALLVDGVTKISRVVISDGPAQKAESLRKMILAMGKDIRVVLVKLADRLHNLRTIRHLSPAKQASIARETQEIYLPIASRLGMMQVKSEYEDLCFSILQPEKYEELRALADARLKDREAGIAEVVALLQSKLRDLGVEGKVTGRSKHLAGVYQKMVRRGIDFGHVYDFIAYRIICRSVRECYEALGVVHSIWKPVPGRFKDYVAMPKGNRYQSLHTTVFGPGAEMMEIQIRTEEMHSIAEYGVAAHWKYKEGRRTVDKDDQMFMWLRQILELQREMKDPREFMNTVKVELYPEEVYVYTPRGDVKTLPRNATPIDFAYAIHTEVGHHCVGARVNGKLVPLKTPLKNGDVVDIVTNQHHRPSRDWLKIALSHRALSKIRAFVRQEEQERSLDLGRQLAEKELRRYSLSLLKVVKLPEFEAFIKEHGWKSADDFYVSVGYGKTPVVSLLRQVLPPEALHERVPREGEKEKAHGRGAKGGKKHGAITVKGLDDIFVRIANCCHPVPGEPILGFVTRGRGVTVHSSDCRKALDTDPARAVEVEWEGGAKATHPVKLRVVGNDKPGLLAEISRTITANDVDIRRAAVLTTKDRKAICDFDVFVNDMDHLSGLMKAIEKVKNVISVERGKG